MRGAHLGLRGTLGLAGILVAGTVVLALAIPPDRTVAMMFEADGQLDLAAEHYRRWGHAHPRDYASRWRTVELLLTTTHVEDAVSELEAMGRMWPGDVHILGRLVEIEDSLLRVAGAAARLEQLSAARPDDPALLARLADHYRWFGLKEKLVDALVRLTRLGEHLEERTELIEILLASRRYEELIAICEQSLATRPDDVATHLALYQAYLRTGRTELASAEVRRVIALEPTKIEHLRELGETLITAGRWEEAMRLFDERLAADPTEPGIRADLLELYQSMAETLAAKPDGRARAIELLRRRIEMDPTNVEARLGFAELHGERANEVAIAQLEELTSFAPESLDGWRALGDHLSWASRLGPAIRAYRRVLDLAPGDVAARRTLAQHHLWADQLPEALAEYRRVIQLEDRAIDRAAVVEILLDEERGAEALEEARRLVKLAPTARHRHLVARAALELEDCATALPELRWLTGPDGARSRDADIWYDLSMCATRLGAFDEAFKALRTARELRRPAARPRVVKFLPVDDAP